MSVTCVAPTTLMRNLVMSRLRLRQKASVVEGLVSICFQGIKVLILAHSRSHSLLFGGRRMVKYIGVMLDSMLDA